jgi:transcription elongation factor Elf1
MKEEESLRDLKLRINILDVLEKIGARTILDDRWSDDVKVYCPFCDDATSTKPAARANVMRGWYRCYACGVWGSVIDLALEHLSRPVQLTDEVDPVLGKYTPGLGSAIRWLRENFPATPAEEEDDPWSE